MNEAVDKAAGFQLRLSPRKKLALILVVMLAGVVATDSGALSERTPAPQQEIDDFSDIDAMLAEFDSPAPAAESADEVAFADGEQAVNAASPDHSAATPPLMIPSSNDNVTVQPVSLPQTSEPFIGHENDRTTAIASGDTPVQATPTSRIRFTGSIFPTP